MKDFWLEIVSIALGAGGLGALFTFKLGNRKQNTSDFQIIVEKYEKLNDEYKAELRDLRQREGKLEELISGLEKKVIDLQNKLIIFESSHGDVPIPIWLKDTNGVMLYLNEEYERKLLHPIEMTKENYIGKTDFDIWSLETAMTFQQHDKQVLRKKEPIEFFETWEAGNGITYEGNIIKYPRFLNRTVIGIGGVIISIKEVKNEANK